MKLQSNRGSVLLSAAILGAIMAVAAATYLAVSLSSFKRANRAFYYNSALNLAEAGAEEAMWALNNTADTPDWSKRAWSGTTTRTLLGSANSPDFTDLNGVKGYYNVLVENASTYNPTITVESILNIPNGSPVRKQIKIDVTRTTSTMPNIAAKDWAKVSGILDSYDPALGNYTTAPRGYDMTVASPSVDVGDLALGSNGTIYGHISIGVDSDNSAAYVATIKGNLLSATTTYPSSGVVKSGSNLVDTNLISYDYTQDFPMPDGPTGSVYATSLPAPNSQGYIIIGDSSSTPTTRRYDLSSISIGTNQTLLIVGPVKLVVSGDVTVSGQGAINILNSDVTVTTGNGNNAITNTYTGSTKATAEIYAYNDVSISGNGTAIPLSAGGSDPSKLKIYGMDPNGQTITIGGNGNLAAAINAPAASLVFNGGGSTGYFAGTMIGNTIKINGAGYQIRTPKGGGQTTVAKYFTVTKWMELTDRTIWHTF